MLALTKELERAILTDYGSSVELSQSGGWRAKRTKQTRSDPEPECQPEPELEPEPEFVALRSTWVRCTHVKTDRTGVTRVTVLLAEALTSEMAAKLFDDQLRDMTRRITESASNLGTLLTNHLTGIVERWRRDRTATVHIDESVQQPGTSQSESTNCSTVPSLQLPCTAIEDPLARIQAGDEVEVLIGPGPSRRSYPLRGTAGFVEPDQTAHWAIGTVTAVASSAATAAPLVRIVVPEASPASQVLRGGFSNAIRVATPVVASSDPVLESGDNAGTAASTETGKRSLVVSLDSRPFFVRARAVGMVLRREPSALQGSIVQYIPPESLRDRARMQQALVASLLPAATVAGGTEAPRHILVREEFDAGSAAMRIDGAKRCEMADLRCRAVVHEGGAAGLAVEPRSIVAPLGSHTTECLACCARFPRNSMAEYCWGFYQVTGDGTTKKDPRHPDTLCTRCLTGYAKREVEAGKLHIKCPSCPRSLQMRECRELIGTDLYEALVQRVAQAEKRLHGAGDDAGAALVAAGLQCRSCPKCFTRIEKNAGCDEMVCYLCGHRFVWQSAQQVELVRTVSSARDGGSGTARTARTRATGARGAARNVARRTARDAARQAATEARHERVARTPPQWVLEQLPSPPMAAPSFVPSGAATTATINRLARPRHRPPASVPPDSAVTAAVSGAATSLDVDTEAGSRLTRRRAEGAGRSIRSTRSGSGTPSRLHPSPRVIDATRAAQEREERRVMAMLSTHLQSLGVTSNVRRLAERRREKQRRLRKKFESQQERV